MPGRIIIPMITPHKNDSVDSEALHKLVEYAKESGFDGLFAMSSTGGCASVSFRKHVQVLREVKEKASGIDLFANISRNDLDESLNMLGEAEDMGYEKFVVINPYYHRYSEESMKRFFSAIAGKVKGSLYLYNNPALTGLTLSPEVVRSVSEEHSSVKGIKDSGGDLQKFREFLEITGIEVYQGKDHLLLESMELGAFGGVCSTSNFSRNTLKVAHGDRDAKSYAERISKVTEIMKNYEVPAFHNYMFRRFIAGEEKPENYMNYPFGDLLNPPDYHSLKDIV